MRKRIQRAGLVLLVLAACGKDPSEARRAVDGSRFKGRGYTITAPDGWEKKQGVVGADVVFLSPVDGAKDQFRENFNVVLENIPVGISRQEYFDATKTNLAKFLTGFVLLAEEEVAMGGRDWLRLEYTMTQGAFEFHNDVYLFVRNGSAYVITCACLPGENSRERYLPAMRECIESFALGK